MDLDNPRISGADLFLLERWQNDPSQDSATQLTNIFNEYVTLGSDGRQPYLDRLKERQIFSESDLNDVERETLTRIRQPAFERMYMPDNGLFLRTCYSPGTDGAFFGVITAATTFEFPESLVLNNASLYDFGRDWGRVFARMPQLLENPFLPAQRRRQQILGALQDARQREEASQNADPPEAIAPSDLYEAYHWAAKVGSLFVIDEATLSRSGPDAGKLLVVWFDDRGREVRSFRQDPLHAIGTTGLIYGGYVRDHDVWRKAKVGSDYDGVH